MLPVVREPPLPSHQCPSPCRSQGVTHASCVTMAAPVALVVCSSVHTNAFPGGRSPLPAVPQQQRLDGGSAPRRRRWRMRDRATPAAAICQALTGIGCAVRPPSPLQAGRGLVCPPCAMFTKFMPVACFSHPPPPLPLTPLSETMTFRSCLSLGSSSMLCSCSTPVTNERVTCAWSFVMCVALCSLFLLF